MLLQAAVLQVHPVSMCWHWHHVPGDQGGPWPCAGPGWPGAQYLASRWWHPVLTLLPLTASLRLQADRQPPPSSPPRWPENNNKLLYSTTESFVSPCNVNPAKSHEATVKICLMVEILYDVMVRMKNYCQLWWLEGPDTQIGLIPVRCHIHQS